MDLTQLENLLNKEHPYRLKQAKKALFVDLIEDWREANILPLLLRENLNKICPIKINAQTLFSKDKKTAKTLIILKDGLKIESVLMKHKDGRNTVCISSQVGCALSCSFCATGQTGFKRNLEISEIVEQVLFFARHLKKKGEKVTNIVFMGMGEPFLNYENVISAIRVLNDKEGFNLGARHISISTVGILEGIKKLAEEKLQVNLAISLHAPDDDLRSKIMPINKKYPIADVLEVVDDYIGKTKRKVMFEYLMMKDLNDSDVYAQKLSKLMKKPLYFVNLISYNPTGVFKPSSSWRMKKFKEILEKGGVQVTQRYRFGQDIKAACGQLAS
ncbi:MAG: 23S rRNA (adenine(2503)-C(2))-methyltransferase RlmN [Candidatus Nealsonbacteria bacterium]|nr:MAG: 23S rRNA (adenine(2503)-C(2))-methyltransferase RlmN [Candidatus Nealsonbacteria bacterium]